MAAKKKNGFDIQRENFMRNTYVEEKVPPAPFNENFLKNVSKVSNASVNPSERLDYNDLKEFINKFEIGGGVPFDDPAVVEKYMGKNIRLIMGFIEVRRFLYLICIGAIKNLTIEEFAKCILSPSRKKQMAICEVIDLLNDYMDAKLVKNHRLNAKSDSSRPDYTMHAQKILELTEDGKALVNKIVMSLPKEDKDLLDNAVIRRQLYVERMRKTSSFGTASKGDRKFSDETYDVIERMKKLLAKG